MWGGNQGNLQEVKERTEIKYNRNEHAFFPVLKE